MDISKNVQTIQDKIEEICDRIGRNPKSVSIVGVTKYVDAEVANQLLESGISHLGENRPEVLIEKINAIEKNVNWHFVGSLQSRKVRGIIDQVDYLHSLDRLRLAQEIDKHAPCKVKCFVQVNVSKEESKHGIDQKQLIDFIMALKAYPKIEVVGLMTMAPFTEDQSAIRHCFKELKSLQLAVQNLNLSYAPCKELSMGMSNDFEIAIEEGATFIRLGRSLTEVQV